MPPAEAPPFARLLIANRAEIAIRLIRACAELGIRSIAVYSEADQDALHTRLADEAHLIGLGPATESYLSIARIIEVARISGAQAIHPGYGFLSENPLLAEACAEAGLIFIGPSASAMRLLGDKAAARRLAAQHGVPIVPGYDGADQDDRVLAAEAARIGYPLLVKAAAGGGGRGMRVAQAPADLTEALAAARREASAAFGDHTLILERLVVGARHVEVQVLGDHHGGLIHLGERDCSVQRRHQKVIEESPAPAVSPKLRTALGEAALRVARAAGYVSAGTCEFLLDAAGAFWFIEMNARLQVEHPVTELVTGLDLVRAQIEIAAGRPLRWRQEEIDLRGHAVECRVYAEDPARDDLPSPGRLTRFQPPLGPGLRHDVGYGDGDVVPPFYDTMLGKLIAFGEDRASAVSRARAALDRYVVEGIPTNRPLLAWILDHPTFRAGIARTDFLALERPARAEEVAAPPEALAAALVWELNQPARPASADVAGMPRDWRIAGQGLVTFWLAGGSNQPIALAADREGRHDWRVAIGDQVFLVGAAGDVVTVRAALTSQPQAPALTPEILHQPAGAGEAAPVPLTRFRVVSVLEAYTVEAGHEQFRVRRAPPPAADGGEAGRATGSRSALEASMPGRVVRIAVAVGDTVTARQPLVIVEAMKIENTVASPRAGIVSAVRCAVGDAVSGGQVLVELAAE